jgi:superfamily I DNA/RNA helicase
MSLTENYLSAPHVAAALNELIEQVFKPLVLKDDKNNSFTPLKKHTLFFAN